MKDAEEFYGELEAKIKEDNNRYTMEKLPALLELLGKYEGGSPAQRLYMRKIDEDISLQIEHTARQLEAAAERQGKIIDGILYVKGRVAEQTGQIIEAVNAKPEALDVGVQQLPEVKEVPALPV